MRRQRTVTRSPGLELEELLKLQERRPFRPFELTMVSGQTLRVGRPEDLHVNLVHQRLAVFESDGVSILRPTELARVKMLDG